MTFDTPAEKFGFLYVLMPVGLGVLILLAVAVLLNNCQRQYPMYWLLLPQPAPAVSRLPDRGCVCFCCELPVNSPRFHAHSRRFFGAQVKALAPLKAQVYLTGDASAGGGGIELMPYSGAARVAAIAAQAPQLPLPGAVA